MAITDEHISESGQSITNTQISAGQFDRQPSNYLSRRLKVMFFDLGLDSILPDGWGSPTADGLLFGSLSLNRAEALIRVLEDLTTGHHSASSNTGDGLLSRFD